MKSVPLINNSYNYSEIKFIVIELQRTIMSFTKYFQW
jgi:hypothetical protein